MGRIGKIKAVEGRRIIVDTGGGPNVTADQFLPPGDDSQPLLDDYCLLSETQRTGGAAVVGGYDPVNTPKSSPGEKRIYARDGDGILIVEVWLKSDGTCEISNNAGSLELQPSGSFIINGVIIDPAGNISTPAKITAENVVSSTSLTVGGVEMSGHKHNQGADDNGDNQQPTDEPS